MSDVLSIFLSPLATPSSTTPTSPKLDPLGVGAVPHHAGPPTTSGPHSPLSPPPLPSVPGSSSPSTAHQVTSTQSLVATTDSLPLTTTTYQTAPLPATTSQNGSKRTTVSHTIPLTVHSAPYSTAPSLPVTSTVRAQPIAPAAEDRTTHRYKFSVDLRSINNTALDSNIKCYLRLVACIRSTHILISVGTHWRS